MTNWTTLTAELSSHPSHKDFVMIEIDGKVQGADYLYCQFSGANGDIIDESRIARWRLMSDKEVSDWGES